MSNKQTEPRYSVWYNVNRADLDIEHRNRTSRYSIKETSTDDVMVTFPVHEWVSGEGYRIRDKVMQRRRAYALCDYMNRMEGLIADIKLEVS
jgi:ATP-dependent exoDNAse (exonuclease V) alpha subunit